MKINASNYYEHFSPENVKGTTITTDFFRLSDVVPVMKEELKRAGHDYIFDRVIYALENEQVILLSVYSRKSNIGFLYIEGHELSPSKSDRDFMFKKDKPGIHYGQVIESYSGKVKFAKIHKLPSNVFVFKEECYFFQYTDNEEDNKVLVTKETALEILRQDIRKYLTTERSKTQ